VDNKQTQILDPTPDRRKHVTDVLYAFLNDNVSMAELKGLSRNQLFQISDIGFVKLTHGRLDEAYQIFQGLIVLDHRNAYFHGVMGAIHQKLERPIEAIMEYSQALKLNPHDVSTYVNRGELYLRHKNYKKAAQDFKEAIVRDEQGINLWANRARSLVIAIKCSMESDVRRSKVRRSM